jgi:uncharacterized protein YbjT (DUF2867 family)
MILVTGATGNVGSEIVRLLLEGKEEVRVYVRDAAKTAAWEGRAEVSVGDLNDVGAFARAVEGASGVFLMNVTPDAGAFRKLVDAAKESGAPRAVFLSTILAGNPEATIGRIHKEKEDVLRASGLRARFLRPGGFMSNALQWAETIKRDGVVYNPMGSGPIAPIAPVDVANVGVHALTRDDVPEVLELTGGEVVTVPQQVETLAKVLGKAIRCVDISIETAVENMVRSGFPTPIAKAVSESFAIVRSGRAPTTKDTVGRVTGRRPVTFEAWARANASRFV